MGRYRVSNLIFISALDQIRKIDTIGKTRCEIIPLRIRFLFLLERAFCLNIMGELLVTDNCNY